MRREAERQCNGPWAQSATWHPRNGCDQLGRKWKQKRNWSGTTSACAITNEVCCGCVRQDNMLLALLLTTPAKMVRKGLGRSKHTWEAPLWHLMGNLHDLRKKPQLDLFLNIQCSEYFSKQTNKKMLFFRKNKNVWKL